MPKIIVTSRYMKSGSKRKSNYVKYIATREGSVSVKSNVPDAPATQKQKDLISSLLKEFPESKNSFEYSDYKANPTQQTASDLISEILESNADQTATKENYVGYLANRPKAVKFGTHGLFSQEDTPVDLNVVIKEVGSHAGNVWTHVIIRTVSEMDNHQEITSTAFKLLINLSRIIEEDYNQSERTLQSQTDSKLRQIIRRKKSYLGMKEEQCYM